MKYKNNIFKNIININIRPPKKQLKVTYNFFKLMESMDCDFLRGYIFLAVIYTNNIYG